MKHWAYVTATCYAAFLVLLTIPVLAISGWELPAIEAYQQWGYWLWIGLFVICQFCLLLIPVSIAERRPVRRRHVGFLVGTTSFLLANLVLAGVLALGAGIFGDDSSRPIEWFGDKSSQNPILVALAKLLGMPTPGSFTLGCLGVFATLATLWAIWLVVFSRFAASHDPESLLNRATRWLLRGSILELLVAVPSHIMVRRRDDCCARVSTFWGIALGISVMLIAFGPAVFFLFAQRIRRLQPKPSTEPLEPVTK